MSLPAKLESFTTVNPATEEELAAYPIPSPRERRALLEAGRDGQAAWAALSPTDRGNRFRALAAVLRKNADADARTMSLEMGKPVTEALQEVEKCAWLSEYYADNAAPFLRDREIATDASRSLVTYEPLGIVLGIMPWNYPFWQAFRAAIPIIASGNGFLLKHAENVLGSGNAIADRCAEALGQGVVQHCICTVDDVPDLLADPAIAGLTLTGSPGAGSSAAGHAARLLKPSLLELGGSDAFIVLDDADIDKAASVAARARFQNCGQTCIAAKRFFVDASVSRRFIEGFAAAAGWFVPGDPLDSATTLGPLCRERARSALEDQMSSSIAKGAVPVLEGGRPEGPGWYLRPAILANCEPGMAVFDEETFGPVASVTTFTSDDDAVALANASPYGLGGNIWTSDTDRGVALGRRLRTGGVFINGMTHSDPRLPFGGVGQSGYGRELSIEGTRAFVNAKTIWVG